tara:strand:+ start:1779 stop:2591 length:813 start_codon:yes stop_codon:yes gene_type:complete
MRNRNENKINYRPPQQPQNTYTAPTDIVHLPSGGKFYPEGHSLHGKESVEVYFMTTKEEDILVNAAYNREGIVFDKLIESILVDKSLDPTSFIIGDRNAILINARKNAYGHEYGVRVSCEECFSNNEIQIDLDEIGNKEVDYSNVEITGQGTFLLHMPKSEAQVELQLLTGQDEQEMVAQATRRAKHNLPEEPISGKYARMIKSVDGKEDPISIRSYISNMPIMDSRLLRKTYLNVMPDVDFVYRFSCKECEHFNEGGVPFTGDFFWPNE